jgi:isocitrate dehydrogenase kinase/phosphatase
MFPHKLTDSRAFDIAQALLDGFNRHYRLFREASAAAKRASSRPTGTASSARSASASSSTTSASTRRWTGCAASSRSTQLSMDSWQQVKLHYIGLLTDHHQPELAETFFNSVTAKLLHRSYFRNDFIFVRPAVSTEYIENDEPAATPTYRAYYPTRETLHDTWCASSHNFQLQAEFEDLDRDVDTCWRPCSAREPALRRMAAARQLPDPGAVLACSSATRAPTSWARSSTASPRRRCACPSARPDGRW